MSPIYVPGKVVLKKEFTVQDYMWNFPQQYGLWSPAEITTALWLDAADASTITESGGAVSQWNDKSGSNRHAVQSTLTNKPTSYSASLNSLNVIRYDATDDFMSLQNTGGLTTATSFYVFAVRRSSVASAADTVTSRPLLAGVGASYSIGADSTVIFSGETTVFIQGPDVTPVFPRVGADSANYARQANTAELYDVFTTSASNSFGARVNGAPIQSYLTNQSTGRFDPGGVGSLAGFNIGGAGAGSNGAIVDFAELIVLTTQPSLETILKLEGYRAHKWGLTANLPNNHPYKLVGPTL